MAVKILQEYTYTTHTCADGSENPTRVYIHTYTCADGSENPKRVYIHTSACMELSWKLCMYVWN
jgi:hypothetical protein